MDVIDRWRIERRIEIMKSAAAAANPQTAHDLDYSMFLGVLRIRLRLACDAAALEALIAWADAAQEELYELKALVEQRGWHKGQAAALAALMARWPRKGA